MIPVQDDDKIVGRVQYNTNLDYWDGSNNTCGSPGRHKGLTRITIDGEKCFVLIHGTQWQGERTTAEIISDEQALQEILRAENEKLLEKYFPDYEDLEEE